MTAILKAVALVGGLVLAGAPAWAANVLDGQTITVNLSASDGGGRNYGDRVVVAGSGNDGSYFSNPTLSFDVNAGANGDVFSASIDQSRCGIDCASDTVTWTVSGLNLGGPITGIRVLDSFTPITLTAHTPTSITFSYSDVPFTAGTLFDVEYVVGVPEPGAWSLMILGFGLIGGIARARRARARSDEWAPVIGSKRALT